MKSSTKFLALILGIFIGIPATGYAQYDGLDLSAHDITSLSAVGVTPEYVKAIRALGYDDISANDITSLYAVGVKPDYIKHIQALGYDDISANDITSLYAVGVKSDYVKQIKTLGFDDISIHDIVQFYATGVTPEYIKQMKDSGIGESHKIKVHIPEIHIPEIHISEIHIPEIHIPEIDVKIDKAREKRQHHAVVINSIGEDFPFLTGGLTLAFALLLGGIGYLFYLRNRQQPVSQPTEDIDTRISIFEKRIDDLQDILLSIDHRIDRRLRKI